MINLFNKSQYDLIKEHKAYTGATKNYTTGEIKALADFYMLKMTRQAAYKKAHEKLSRKTTICTALEYGDQIASVSDHEKIKTYPLFCDAQTKQAQQIKEKHQKRAKKNHGKPTPCKQIRDMVKVEINRVQLQLINDLASKYVCEDKNITQREAYTKAKKLIKLKK